MRQYALDVRRHLGIADELYFPVVEFLESMGNIFSDSYFEIVEDEELTEGHTITDLNEGCIRIRRTVYDRTYKGYGRDRMTIAYEIGHYFSGTRPATRWNFQRWRAGAVQWSGVDVEHAPLLQRT